MNITLDSLFPAYKAKAPPTEALQSLLVMITAQIPADLVCIYEYHQPSNTVKTTVAERIGKLSKQEQDRACALVSDRVPELVSADEPQIITLDAPESTPLQATLLYPFPIIDGLVGVLALFSSAKSTYKKSHFQQSATFISLIRAVLENYHLNNALAENLSTARSILHTAQTIAENPSPQYVVNILRDTLF